MKLELQTDKLAGLDQNSKRSQGQNEELKSERLGNMRAEIKIDDDVAKQS